MMSLITDLSPEMAISYHSTPWHEEYYRFAVALMQSYRNAGDMPKALTIANIPGGIHVEARWPDVGFGAAISNERMAEIDAADKLAAESLKGVMAHRQLRKSQSHA